MGGASVSSGAVRLAIGAEIGASVVRAVKRAASGADAEVVGSVRRCRPIVGDVEILVDEATPTQVRFALHSINAERGPPNKRGARAPWGDRYFKAVIPYQVDDNVGRCDLDVFVCLPPADYGVLRLIRTGSAHFSQAVVTRLHRYGLESRDGHIVNRSSGAIMPAPTEETVLRLARLAWIPPTEREMDNPATLAEFRREAAPWECQDRPIARLCPTCGMVHIPGACR